MGGVEEGGNMRRKLGKGGRGEVTIAKRARRGSLRGERAGGSGGWQWGK